MTYEHKIKYSIPNNKQKKRLFVAVRNPELINIYEQQSRHLFTRTHYEELKLNDQLPRAHHRSNSRPQSYQSHSRDSRR